MRCERVATGIETKQPCGGGALAWSFTQISRERGQALADEFGITFFETSAKDGTNVTEAFHAIAAEAVRNLQDREKGDAGSVPKVKHVRTNQRDGKCRIM